VHEFYFYVNVELLGFVMATMQIRCSQSLFVSASRFVNFCLKFATNKLMPNKSVLNEAATRAEFSVRVMGLATDLLLAR